MLPPCNVLVDCETLSSLQCQSKFNKQNACPSHAAGLKTSRPDKRWAFVLIVSSRTETGTGFWAHTHTCAAQRAFEVTEMKKKKCLSYALWSVVQDLGALQHLHLTSNYQKQQQQQPTQQQSMSPVNLYAKQKKSPKQKICCWHKPHLTTTIQTVLKLNFSSSSVQYANNAHWHRFSFSLAP